jgi:hypothetical protein
MVQKNTVRDAYPGNNETNEEAHHGVEKSRKQKQNLSGNFPVECVAKTFSVLQDDNTSFFCMATHRRENVRPKETFLSTSMTLPSLPMITRERTH